MAERVHAVGAARLDAGRFEGGLPHVAVEVVAVDRVALAAREHEVVAAGGVAAEMLGELGGDRVGQRDGAGLAALRSVDDEPGPHDLHLLLDVDPPAQEVDVADPEPERLALAEPAAGGDDPERPVAARQRVDDRLDLLDAATARSCVTGRFGSLTDPARHGLVAMSPSSTAALNTAETLVRIVRT